MAELGKGSRGPRSTDLTTPEAFPTTAPQLPSGDYSYTVELVGAIQNQLGRLTEAVDRLKTETADQGKRLLEVSQDIHTAKITVKIVGAILAALLAFAGWVGNKAIDAFVQSRQSPVTQQTKP